MFRSLIGSSRFGSTGPRLRRFGLVATTLLTTAAAGTWSASAQACGGLFCSAANPVNQAAERIIFAQGSDGKITQIVEILYEGPADEFAWVLPVPGVPEPDVSSATAFQRLQTATNPVYRIDDVPAEGCRDDRLFAPTAGATDDAQGEGSAPPEVTVLDSGTVGPFDFETISVDPGDQDPADVAIRWLDDNGYDVGALGPDVLRPYLANGMNLIAFRLSKDSDTGQIQPVTLTYQAGRPAIPIRPTAVAANDDMGILVWVLGQHRAVPINYRGLELNELLINWFNPTPTYNDVVTAAANEAGSDGHGFVTEMAGESVDMHDVVDSGNERDIVDVALQDSTLEQSLISLGQSFAQYDGAQRAFAKHVTVRQGLTVADFLSCPRCYFEPELLLGSVDYGIYDAPSDPISETDLSALGASILEDVIRPIEETADLFEEHPYMTRLYTTMSAEEMDEDPEFDFNPDLENVSNIHVAERYLTCDGPSGAWRVVLPDEREVFGEGTQWPFDPLNAGDMPFNSRIVKFGTSGQARLVRDNRSNIAELFNQNQASEPNTLGRLENDGSGCRMAASPATSSWIWLLALGGAGLLSHARRRPIRAVTRQARQR